MELIVDRSLYILSHVKIWPIWQGWGIFQYYKFWFILTLCTFPAAYIGWYIKKKNWLSLVILMPMLILLALIAKGGINHVIYEFPHLLLMVVFCVAQILLYHYVFTENVAQKIAMQKIESQISERIAQSSFACTPTIKPHSLLKTATKNIITILIYTKIALASVKSILRLNN